MEVEILIYCYGAVCLSMILFNFLCIFAFKGRERRALRQSHNFTKHIEHQIELLENGEELSEKEYRYLTRKLKKVGNLVAFDRALEDFYQRDKETAAAYLKMIYRVLLFLASEYLEKEGMQASFFLSFVNKYRITSLHSFDSMIGIIMKYFKKPSVYCSLNAMDALYISGQTDNVMQGLKTLNSKDSYFHSKLIIRGLCGFAGEHEKLAEKLMNGFDDFSVVFKVAIIDYLASIETDFNEFVFELLINEKQHEEIRYSAIRYFGKHIYNPAYSVLCNMANNLDPAIWIYTSQAVNSLASYLGEKTVSIIKKALTSANWYVRYNAAESLEKLCVTYNELQDVIDGGDRYAREIITYRSEHNSLKERQVAPV